MGWDHTSTDGISRKLILVKNKKGVTYVCNAGSNGKFLNVLDLDIKKGKVQDFRFTLLPIFSNLIPADNRDECVYSKG